MGQFAPLNERVILIVEDEAIVRFGLVEFFEDAGWQAFEARNAEAAIALLKANPAIRAVLVDIALPGEMDGMKLAHYVRERYPPTKLFITSGVRAILDEELPSDAVFLQKPFDTRRLLHRIERALITSQNS